MRRDAIALGSDHAGFQLKEKLKALLGRLGYRVKDVGAYDESPSDYPDFAREVGVLVSQGRTRRGIMICGSGVGASIAANKVPRVRAALCHDLFTARQSVQDDDANVLCLGSRDIGAAAALRVAREWLRARFSGAARHKRRLAKISSLERRFMRGRA